jgi:hypothetical protein
MCCCKLLKQKIWYLYYYYCHHKFLYKQGRFQYRAFEACVCSSSLVGIASSYPTAVAFRFVSCECRVLTGRGSCVGWSLVQRSPRSVGCPMYVIPKTHKVRHDPEWFLSSTKNANKLENNQRMFAPVCFVVFHHIPYNYIYELIF